MRLIVKEFQSFLRVGISIEIFCALFIGILLYSYNPGRMLEMQYDTSLHYIGYLFEKWYFSSFLFLTPILGIIVGIEIMSKEIKQKTLASLAIRPLSRSALLGYKFVSGILIIISLFVIPHIFISLYSEINGISIPWHLIYTSILYTSLLVSVFYALTFFIATITHITFLPLIISLISWMGCLYLSRMSDYRLTKLLPLHLITKRHLIITNSIDSFEILYWLSAILLLFCGSYAFFKNKDIS